MYIRHLIILLLLAARSGAQTHRIDSIRKLIPGLSGRNQVDNFNALAQEYYFYWIHSDSALKYSELAYQKASGISYISGKAEALLIRAGVEGRLLGNPRQMENYAQQAIDILKDQHEPKTLSKAVYNLGVAFTIQGKYQLAQEPFEKAKQLAVQVNDKSLIGWAEQGIGFMYFKSGKYWKSFEHLIQAQQLGKEVNDSVLVSLSFAIIARTFNQAGDPQAALNYYHQSFQYSNPFICLWGHHEDMAYAHLQLKQLDSAEYYQQLNNRDMVAMTTDPKIRSKFIGFQRGYSIDIQLARKQFDSVLTQVLPVLQKLRESKDVVPYMQSLFILGKVYEAKGEHKTALQYGRELYQVAASLPSKRLLRDASELLSSVFSHLRQGDSAFRYYKQYTILKDSLETVQYAGRTALYLAASESESKIRLLQKDQEINKQQLALNRKELQKQSQLKNLLVVGLIALLGFFFLIFRNITLKRKNEKLQYEQAQLQLKRKAAELEMQALRAQMNPHFIFNCLSAIDNLIQTNQPEKATNCLVRFARLIRGVLDSSKNNLVPFQQDFETLKLYLEMEQFRCNNKFAYELKADEGLIHGDYKVPPLIIQPFVENAIHHGLLNKRDGDRQLTVLAQLAEEHIIYSITDNGIGREKAAHLKEMNRPGQQSYGTDITRERIQLHNKNGITNDLIITDLKREGRPSGTKAVVRINCIQ